MKTNVNFMLYALCFKHERKKIELIKRHPFPFEVEAKVERAIIYDASHNGKS